jgi:hypothetical protein
MQKRGQKWWGAAKDDAIGVAVVKRREYNITGFFIKKNIKKITGNLLYSQEESGKTASKLLIFDIKIWFTYSTK